MQGRWRTVSACGAPDQQPEERAQHLISSFLHQRELRLQTAFRASHYPSETQYTNLAGKFTGKLWGYGLTSTAADRHRAASCLDRFRTPASRVYFWMTKATMSCTKRRRLLPGCHLLKNKYSKQPLRCFKRRLLSAGSHHQHGDPLSILLSFPVLLRNPKRIRLSSCTLPGKDTAETAGKRLISARIAEDVTRFLHKPVKEISRLHRGLLA